jgi:thiaminase/transcriptional activator TenA
MSRPRRRPEVRTIPPMLTQSILRDSRPALSSIAREPFLVALAEDRLSDAALGRWVREDTHFLHALRRSTALLVADAPSERAVDVITSAYPALRSELDRFAEAARRIGEEIGSDPQGVTRRFNELLFSSARAGFAEGIGVYWAVEMAYLEAWSTVRDAVGVTGTHAGWIENWTSEAFRAFVADLGVLVDEHADPRAARRGTAEVLSLEQELWRWCHEGD